MLLLCARWRGRTLLSRGGGWRDCLVWALSSITWNILLIINNSFRKFQTPPVISCHSINEWKPLPQMLTRRIIALVFHQYPGYPDVRRVQSGHFITRPELDNDKPHHSGCGIRNEGLWCRDIQHTFPYWPGPYQHKKHSTWNIHYPIKWNF